MMICTRGMSTTVHLALRFPLAGTACSAAARLLIVKLHWHRNQAPQGEPRPVWYTGGLADGSFTHVCAWPDAAIDATGEPAREYKRS